MSKLAYRLVFPSRPRVSGLTTLATEVTYHAPAHYTKAKPLRWMGHKFYGDQSILEAIVDAMPAALVKQLERRLAWH